MCVVRDVGRGLHFSMSAHPRRRWLAVLVGVVIAASVASLVGHGLIASAIAYAPSQYGAADESETLTRAERAGLGRHATVAVRVRPARRDAVGMDHRARGAPRGTIVLLHGIRADKRMMIGPGRALPTPAIARCWSTFAGTAAPAAST